MAQGLHQLSSQEYKELKQLAGLTTEQRKQQGKQERYLFLQVRYAINAGKK